MRNLFSEKLTGRIEACGVIAVLVIDRVEDAVPLAKALLAGGIDVMELTLRTPAAIEALKEIKRNVPEMIAGIGTILTPEQVMEAKAAGAEFGVAPGMNSRVVAKAKDAGLPFAPGICTPSDIEAALEHGCRLLKFFPAETSGGLKHLKNMSAPYVHLGLKFIPLGGLDQNNLASYLADPSVAAVGGSWIAKRETIKANDWAAITAAAAKATETVKAIRGK
ncbi:MAG: bifunctional 4-hydroxy-2-oxoglutarate aldolase/2-dehydro-3-deoxy-phosphogluconate aldolase [Lentisphaerota bacterium]